MHPAPHLSESGSSGSVAGLAAAPYRPTNGKTVAVVGISIGAVLLLGAVGALVMFGGGSEDETAPIAQPTTQPVASDPPHATTAPEEPTSEQPKGEPSAAVEEPSTATPAPRPSPVAPRPTPVSTPRPQPKDTPPPTTLDVPKPPPPPPPPPKPKDKIGF
jgi:hypothetical protein